MGKMGMGKEGMQGTGRNTSVSTPLPRAKIQGAQVFGFFPHTLLFFFQYLSSYNISSFEASFSGSLSYSHKQSRSCWAPLG